MPGFSLFDSSSFPGGLGKVFDPAGILSQQTYEPDNVSQDLASLSRSQWSQAAALQYPLQNQLINFA